MGTKTENAAGPSAPATGSAAWLRGADAAYREEQFFEEPRNPYKPGTRRAADWKEGYDQWSLPRPACRHECGTKGREGQTGSWCVKCGLKIYEVEARECRHCAHFKDIGVPGAPRAICSKHLMGVTRDMHVNYEIAKGTCFSPNK